MSIDREMVTFIRTALPYAPHAVGLALTLDNGTNTAFCPAERKVIRRLAKIEDSLKDRVEFVATQMILNASQALRGSEGARQCVRNGLTTLINLTTN